jgi:transglutaminase-like putative cysteine protease
MKSMVSPQTPALIRAFRAIALLAIFGSAGAFAKTAAPAWIATAAARPHPQYARSTTAEVLYDDAVNTVGPDGKITTVARYAIRVLKRPGRDYAVMRTTYNTDSEKIVSVRAWLVRGSGDVKVYTQRDAIDGALSPDALYSESRAIVISAVEQADVGSVFGYEVTTEDRSVFAQSDWNFQADIPVQFSRVTWHVPKGWTVSAMTFNHTPVAPSAAAPDTTTWELHDLPAIPEEPFGPSPAHLKASLGIDLHPPAAASGARIARHPFQSWSDVSTYLTGLQDPPAAPDAATEAKTRAILASAGPTLWDRIVAMGRFAQSVNYVSIDLGLGRGGGYTPHAAAEGLRCNYGDCKDKSTLMRAMLRAAGISSFAVAAYWGDRAAVREEWPSPQQFNHCIVAVQVDASVTAPSVVEHPTLGRLFFFDPTDSNTRPGDLDYDHQGSLVLVVAGAGGGLVRLPFLPPENNRLARTIVAQLSENGSITGTIVEKSSGQGAARERSYFRGSGGAEYRKIIEDWISSSVNGASLSRVTPEDDINAGGFSLTVDFAARSYAQPTGTKLFMMKPAIVSRREGTSLTAMTRTLPVILEPQSFTETTEIALPPGFRVDETIAPTDLTTPFGHYTARCTIEPGRLRFERSLTLRASEVPVENYPEVRKFFEAMVKAEQTPVVLARD